MLQKGEAICCKHFFFLSWEENKDRSTQKNKCLQTLKSQETVGSPPFLYFVCQMATSACQPCRAPGSVADCVLQT